VENLLVHAFVKAGLHPARADFRVEILVLEVERHLDRARCTNVSGKRGRLLANAR